MNYTQSLLLIVVTIFFQNNSLVNKPLRGSIAYVRDEKEIRIIQPDGSGDHQLWTHKDAKPFSGIGDLAWSPDGKSLAFSSGHASATSLFHSDLYLIKQDGSDLRKLTNPPDKTKYSNYPNGKVSVTIRNDAYSFQTSNATAFGEST